MTDEIERAERDELVKAESISDLSERIREGDRTALARGIELALSTRPDNVMASFELVASLEDLVNQPETVRIGVTGAPGSGKSTLIEKWGTQLADSDGKVAVLAIDATDPISGGSLMGDRSQMKYLAVHENAFVRPVPRVDWGVHHDLPPGAWQALLLMEACGYHYIFVETPGSGAVAGGLDDIVDHTVLVIEPMLLSDGEVNRWRKGGLHEQADLAVLSKTDVWTELTDGDLYRQRHRDVVARLFDPEIALPDRRHKVLKAGYTKGVIEIDAARDEEITMLHDLVKTNHQAFNLERWRQWQAERRQGSTILELVHLALRQNPELTDAFRKPYPEFPSSAIDQLSFRHALETLSSMNSLGLPQPKALDDNIHEGEGDQ